MSPSSSLHTTVLDQRGFIFVLPHLGLPDLGGEWRILKAAVGTKAEALDPLFNDKALQTPLRHEGSPEDTAPIAIELEGALWILCLLKPKSASPTAGPPEFYSVKVKRFFPDALNVPRRQLPSDCDWVFFPMSVYHDQIAEWTSPSTDEQSPRGYVFEAGPASEAKALKKKEEDKEKKKNSKPGRELTEWETLSGNFLNDDWCRAVKIDTMLEQADRGNLSLGNDPDGLSMRIRVHPAEDHEYRSLDYCILSKAEEEKGGAIAAEKWKPLPPGAAKPGAERHWVNIGRVGKGKRPFSKEEWPPAPVAREGGSDAAKG